MKCLIHLVLMTSSLLIASIATQDDLSHSNLQKLKRAALRRNTGKPPKVPKFGWGKRGSEVEDFAFPQGEPEKRHYEQVFDPKQSWNRGTTGFKELRQKWNGNSDVGTGGTRKCEWYGCRVERSGWESQYGKRNGGVKSGQGHFDDDLDLDDVAVKRQGDRNGWNSAYGRRRRSVGTERQ